jgi:endonuclease YncB( thermonuclease family)
VSIASPAICASVQQRLVRYCRHAIACTCVALAFCGTVDAAELWGTVVRVSDGDTVIVLDQQRVQHRIRLAGIDAPEKRQPYGAKAREHLAMLLQGKAVVVLWQKRDRYRRLIGRVLPAECPHPGCRRGTDAGLAQISSGLAWHYKIYAREQEPQLRRLYSLAEREAREARLGMWQQPEPTPPWQFRRARMHS